MLGVKYRVRGIMGAFGTIKVGKEEIMEIFS